MENNDSINTNNNGKKEQPPRIGHDFSKQSHAYCVQYLVDLNDPQQNPPFYVKAELTACSLEKLRYWCSHASQVHQQLIDLKLIDADLVYIPLRFNKVEPPTQQQLDEEKEQQQDKEKHKSNNNNNNNNNDNNTNSNSTTNSTNNHNSNTTGRKRSRRDINYGPMPTGCGFVKVDPAEAARFRAGGFKVIESEVNELMGIQFFKKVNGNGQVYYCELAPDGTSKVCALPQQRPLAYDSDDDIKDEGFQNQMRTDPFFINPDGDSRPDKRRRQSDFGHMMSMMIDEDGNFRIGNRAKTRGDVEKDILVYCSKHGVPFDQAFKKMWSKKTFTSALGTPYDLSIEENRDVELKRALLYAVRFDAQNTDLKRMYKKLLEVENDKELDSKRHDVKFSSALQLCTALETSLHRVYEYYKHDMEEKEKLKYLEGSGKVMIMAHMDAQRYETNLPLVEGRFCAFASEIIRPACGRVVVMNVNGIQRIKYDKKLIENYNTLVRSYFKHNAYVVSKTSLSFLPSGPCILFNLGMGCPHSKNCSEESKWHVFWTHWCFKCGPSGLDSDSEDAVHPLVACNYFRGTWLPVTLDVNWEQRSYKRPDMDKLIEKKRAAQQRINDTKGGRGGSRGRGRGRGRGYGRSYGRGSYSGGYSGGYGFGLPQFVPIAAPHWPGSVDSGASARKGGGQGRGRGRGKQQETKQEQQNS